MTKTVVDIAVIVIYLLSVTVVGTIVSRKDRNTREGYFVGGRRFAWPIVGMSLFATGISSMQFVGQAGLGYKIGIAAANPQLVGAFMLGFSAVFFVPLFIRSKVFTVPEILELRFGRTPQVIYSITLFTLGVFGGPFGFYAGGLAVLEILQLDPKYLWVCCISLGFLVALYTVGGGYTAVVMTDFIQGSILLVGGMLVLVMGLMALPELGVLVEAPRSNHLELLLPSADPFMPWTGVVTGLAVASLFFATVNHSMLQKLLGARSVYDARMGMIMAALLKILAVFIIVMPGVIAAYLYPDINPDAAFPTMINRLLPVGLSGLVLAAVIAALMSTADSGVNAMAGIVSLNIYPLIRPEANENESVRVGKIAAALLFAWSILTAPFVGDLGLIFPITLKIAAYMLCPVGVCYLAGRFSRRVNKEGAIWVMTIGYTLGVYLTVFTVFDGLHSFVPNFILDTSFYHINPVLFIFYLILIHVISLLTSPPEKEVVDAFMFSGRIVDPKQRPWFVSFTLWVALIVCLFLGIYLIF
jgi:SSS family solute:Na+ symporter